MYISTRENYDKVSAAEAIKLGMVPSGGLFVPETIPTLSQQQILEMVGLSYQEIAKRILPLFLTDFTQKEIDDCVEQAYNTNSFDSADIVPLTAIDANTYILELWHGPTAAFKDLALQIMPHLLSKSIKKVGSTKEVVILVATSGDTGKAALEGFKNVPGIKIIVFYPYKGVSKVQELQMTTTEGENTFVVAVEGNFDDCQSAVKDIFANQEYKSLLENAGFELSSANSINWGRLLPQIIYYFSSYLNLLARKELAVGEKVNFVVPTGNFGNILAGWYASQMGLPVNKFICASNENNVLTDFFQTGIYNRERQFRQTNSPSMDILISSNLERFLFEISQHDGQMISAFMDSLKTKGVFEIDKASKAKIDATLSAGYATETETLETIKRIYETKGYVLDTHTAVAVKVYEKYVKNSEDKTKTIIDATASPFKFNTSVLQAIKGPEAVKDKDEFTILEELSKVTGLTLHHGLKDLDRKEVLHNKVSSKQEIKTKIKEILNI